LDPQLLVSFPLYNQTLLQYNNFIAIPNRTESVGNHNTRTTAPSQIPVYNQLSLSIQGTGCLIQHQHRWISHQGAGNFPTLALSPTQIHSPFNQPYANILLVDGKVFVFPVETMRCCQKITKT
jgi:hypothetical protein